jgi:hypothetical protein
VHEGKLEYEELLRNNQTLANALAPSSVTQRIQVLPRQINLTIR